MHRSHSRSTSRRHGRIPARRSGTVLTALGLGVLLVTSCTEESGPTGVETPEDQPTSAPAPTDPADGPATDGGGEAPDMIPTPVEETPELVSEHLSSWQVYASPSETELQLAFYSGNPACYGVRSVVEEDDSEVRVATISGTLPNAVDSACTQEARYVSLVVELDEPLAEREVVPLTDVELER